MIQMGQDPLASRTPVRNFRSDLSIACDVADGILALKAAMDALRAGAGRRSCARRDGGRGGERRGAAQRRWPPPRPGATG